MLGVSLNWVVTSTPSRSSPFAIVFLHVRQLARPDLASSIMLAIAREDTPRILSDAKRADFAYRAPVSEQAYPVIATRADPRSEEFRGNHEANLAAVAKLH